MTDVTVETEQRTVSLQPDWATTLPIQQQSVLLLAARGPDGVEKNHPCKGVVRAYRACVIKAAKYGRMMHAGDSGDGFMDLRYLLSIQWPHVVDDYFSHIDSLPHHYHLHLLHGAEILGYKMPDSVLRDRWHRFYLRGVEDMHLTPETEEQMDQRLNDWAREDWA